MSHTFTFDIDNGFKPSYIEVDAYNEEHAREILIDNVEYLILCDCDVCHNDSVSKFIGPYTDGCCRKVIHLQMDPISKQLFVPEEPNEIDEEKKENTILFMLEQISKKPIKITPKLNIRMMSALDG